MRSLLFMALSSLAACAADPASMEPGAGGGGGKADDPTVRSEHARAVVACDLARDASTSVELDAILANLRDYTACVTSANEASLDAIDAALPEDLEYASAFMFDRFHESSNELCGALSAGAVFDYQLHVGEQCLGARARQLASLIDGFVAFEGADRIRITVDREPFSACYGAYDAATSAATAAAKVVDARMTLSTCIDDETRRIALEYLVESIAANGEHTEAQARTLVSNALDAVHEGSSNACTAVASASGNPGGEPEALESSDCMAKAAALVGQLVLGALVQE